MVEKKTKTKNENNVYCFSWLEKLNAVYVTSGKENQNKLNSTATLTSRGAAVA